MNRKVEAHFLNGTAKAPQSWPPSVAVRWRRGGCSRAGALVAAVASLMLLLPARADSLWTQGPGRGLVSDPRATSVGDILSILVQESSAASKDNTTKTAKTAGVDASIASFLFSPQASGLLTQKGQMPALKYSSKSDFEGGGQINNSEKIQARIAVQVIDVLPNGNLVVEGRRTTAFGGETQEAILRGTVRPSDITANNTVFSYNVADASIKFTGKGAVSDAQRKGWFTKLWDKLTPF